MNFLVGRAPFALLVLLSMGRVTRAQTVDPLPATDDVITKMMQSDAQRRDQSIGYTAIRRYMAANGSHHAEMLVGVTCASDGSESFSVLSEEGSGWIRNHVFRRLLMEETEASGRASHESTRITPANYDFQIIGQEALRTGPAYVLVVSPKAPNKYLVDGKIWVDARDFSIVRIEGQPARNPSFWVRSAHIVRTYQKVGSVWLASSTDTTSDIRILGPAELTIENSDYILKPLKNDANNSDNEARSLQ